MLFADEQSRKVAEDYKTAMEAAHITGMIGSDVYSNAESLRQMMESGFCILIIEAGKGKIIKTLNSRSRSVHGLRLKLWDAFWWNKR